MSEPTIFTTQNIRITLPNLKAQVKLIPFGDVHRTSPSCCTKTWLEFLRQAKAEQDDYTYYVAIGDLGGLLATREREAFRKAKLHDSTREVFDAFAWEKCQEFMKEISFMRGHLLGFLEGNHRWVFADGKTCNQRMADAMDCPWLGTVCYYILSIGFETRPSSIGVDLFMYHGKPGGKLCGTSVNQVEDMRPIYPAADIFIMGHDHSCYAMRGRPHLYANLHGDKIIVKDHVPWLVRSGSFERAYVPNVSNYIVGGLKRPTALGTVKAFIGAKRDQSAGGDRLVKDIHFWS